MPVFYENGIKKHVVDVTNMDKKYSTDTIFPKQEIWFNETKDSQNSPLRK